MEVAMYGMDGISAFPCVCVCGGGGGVETEAEFLDVVRTKVFLLAIHSHLY